MVQTEDRRVRRTKRLLRQALTELMLEKDFKDITVTDLVERADINRGTFYVHYRDVYDLREQIENEMINTCRKLIEETEQAVKTNSTRPILKKATDYLLENRDMVRGLLRSSGEENFATKMVQIIEELHARSLPTNQLVGQYIARFVGAGSVAVIQKWLLSEDNFTQDQLIDLIDTRLQHVLTVRTQISTL